MCSSSCRLSLRERTGQWCEQMHLNTLPKKYVRCNPRRQDVVIPPAVARNSWHAHRLYAGSQVWGLALPPVFKSNQFNSVWGRASLQGFSPASRLGAPEDSAARALPPAWWWLWTTAPDKDPCSKRSSMAARAIHPIPMAQLAGFSFKVHQPLTQPLVPSKGKGGKKKQREGGWGTNKINPSRYSLVSVQRLWE